MRWQLFAALALVFGIAMHSGAADTIGIYFDELGQETEVDEVIPGGGSIQRSVYVILSDPSDHVQGGEYGVTPGIFGTPGLLFFGSSWLDPNVVNVCDFGIDNACFGFGQCFAPQSLMILTRWDFLISAGVDVEFCLTGASPSSVNPSQPLYANCGLNDLIPLQPEGSGCLTIRTSDTVSASSDSWGAVRALF